MTEGDFSVLYLMDTPSMIMFALLGKEIMSFPSYELLTRPFDKIFYGAVEMQKERDVSILCDEVVQIKDDDVYSTIDTSNVYDV